jgi:predicted GNAT superfamily acetyltransferase
MPDDPITIRPLTTRADFETCVRLQQETWGRDFSERVPVAILQSVQHLGGVVSGAFDADGRMLGFVFGITGWRDGRPIHWSDMMAVTPAARDAGLGERLKWHQRKSLLDLGVTRAEWTFEPLESRNAHLNLNRLGALSNLYIRDYYGESDATLHAGLGTDRLVVSWLLDSERVNDRAHGRHHLPGPEDTESVPMIADVRWVNGRAVSDEPRTDLDATRLRLGIPASIQELKSADPGLATHWRAMARRAFEAYLPRGYVVTGLVRYGRWSAYLLDRPSPG